MSRRLSAGGFLKPLAFAIAVTAIASQSVAYVPHEDPSDWRWWLHLAQNVSTQGHRGTAFCSKAQDSARVLAHYALSLVRAPGTPAPEAEVEIYNRLGDFCFRDDDYEFAERDWLRALEAAGSSVEPFETWCRLGVLYEEELRRPLDREIGSRARKHLTAVRSSMTPDGSPQFYSLAEIYAGMDLLDRFYSCHRAILAFWQAFPESDPRWAVRSLVFFGEAASKPAIGNEGKPATGQDSAIVYGTQALELALARFGPTDTLVAYVLYRLGDYHSRNGNYDVTAGMWKRAWDIYRLAVPPEHIEYQGGLVRMWGLTNASGRFLEAEDFARRALDLRIRTQGAGHPETGGMWTRLARVYHKTGRFRAADSCYQQALRVTRGALELIPSDVAMALLNIGGLQFDYGDLSGAEATYLEALGMLEAAHGRLHDRTASCLSNLGELYLAWGRTPQAQAQFEAAYAARRDYLSPTHPALASSLEDLAQVQIQKGNADSAAQLLAQSSVIQERQAEWLPGGQADLLARMAEVEALRGDLAKSLELSQASLEKARQAMGPDHPGLAEYFNALGHAQSRLAQWTEAASSYQAGMNFQKHLLGVAHPAFADAYEGYARVCRARGDSQGALTAALEALSLRRQGFVQGAWVMSERDALEFETALAGARNLVLSAYFDANPQKSNMRADAADAILATKGAVSDVALAREATLRAQTDPGTRALQDTLSALRARLWYSFTRGVTSAAASHTEPAAEEIQKHIERLQTEIARSVRSYASVLSKPTLSQHLVAGLDPGSTLIEYVKYRYLPALEGPAEERYAALILLSQRGTEAVHLGGATLIDSLAGAYRRHMLGLAAADHAPNHDDLAAYRSLSLALEQWIWKPLEGQLVPGGRLLIAPDGELNRISFAGLPDDSGYLIEHYRIQYLSSGRDLLRTTLTVGAGAGSGLLALGDPDFDATPEERLQPIAASDPSSTSDLAAYSLNTPRAGCEEVFTGTLERLLGTRREVTQLCSAWNTTSAAPAVMLTGPGASEEAVKRQAGGCQVLHLATHGFYLDGSCGKAAIATPRQAHLARENPLLLSGLLLAGANRDAEEARRLGAEDGVLTALEVAGLNLAGMQLVVLSACESAAGEVKSGEGVYGLRRAFALAGARTVVSALWPVSDWSTIPLVLSLYQEAKAAIPERMQKAALARLADLRKRGEVDHPFLWAAFVVM